MAQGTWGRDVKARRLIEGATYDPATVKALSQAFDEAWASIAHHYSAPAEIERARLTLANSLLAVAAQHGHSEIESIQLR